MFTITIVFSNGDVRKHTGTKSECMAFAARHSFRFAELRGENGSFKRINRS